jgi:hypothetical protein
MPIHVLIWHCFLMFPLYFVGFTCINTHAMSCGNFHMENSLRKKGFKGGKHGKENAHNSKMCMDIMFVLT